MPFLRCVTDKFHNSSLEDSSSIKALLASAVRALIRKSASIMRGENKLLSHSPHHLATKCKWTGRELALPRMASAARTPFATRRELEQADEEEIQLRTHKSAFAPGISQNAHLSPSVWSCVLCTSRIASELCPRRSRAYHEKSRQPADGVSSKFLIPFAS